MNKPLPQSRNEVTLLANKLSDAQSTNRYAGGWSACIRMLRRRGMDDSLVELVIRSKWTRWAADAAKSSKPGNATSADLARYLDKQGFSNEYIREALS